MDDDMRMMRANGANRLRSPSEDGLPLDGRRDGRKPRGTCLRVYAVPGFRRQTRGDVPFGAFCQRNILFFQSATGSNGVPSRRSASTHVLHGSENCILRRGFQDGATTEGMAIFGCAIKFS